MQTPKYLQSDSLNRCMVRIVAKDCRKLRHELMRLLEKGAAFADENRGYAACYHGHQVNEKEALEFYLSTHPKNSVKYHRLFIRKSRLVGIKTFADYRQCVLEGLIEYHCNLELQVWNLAQLVEAYGDDNRLFAATRCGHPVSDHDAWRHYVENKGPNAYAAHHEAAHVAVLAE